MSSPSSSHQMARSAGIFTGATLLSRILGYFRDSMVAHVFGAGLAADAFYAAFRISNLFRRLLGEGALSASFVPVFSHYAEKEGHEETQRFLSAMWTSLLFVMCVLTALGIIFADPLTRLIAHGFQNTPERFELTVQLTRIMFPFLLFVCMAALLTGVLNSFHSFFLPAFAPAFLSIAEIVYLLCSRWVSTEQKIYGLAISVAVGGFLQFGIHLPDLWRKGYHLKLRWDWAHEGVKRVSKLMVPATIGVSVDQINAFVDTICASFLVTGSVTALYYSNRVMQLPLALFGIALSQVALPSMSRSVTRGDHAEVRRTLNEALRLTWFMIAPCTVGFIMLSIPIIQLLFQRGAFDYQATLLTHHALVFYTLGLFAYSSVKILSSAFYAYQNTRTPVTIAMVCVVLNVPLCIFLMRPMGVGGLALATAIISWINTLTLLTLFQKKYGEVGLGRLSKTILQASVACTVMGIALYFCKQATWWGLPQFVQVFGTITIGALTYMLSARQLGMEEWRLFQAMLGRKFHKN